MASAAGLASAGVSSARLDQGGMCKTGDVSFAPRVCPAAKPSDVFAGGSAPPSPDPTGGRGIDFRHEKWGPRRGRGEAPCAFASGHLRDANLGRSQIMAGVNSFGVTPCIEQVCRRGAGSCSPTRQSRSPGPAARTSADAAGWRSQSLDRFEARRAGNFDCVDFICHKAAGECSPGSEPRSPGPEHLVRYRQESARWQSSDIEAACRLGAGACSPRVTGSRLPAVAEIALPHDLPTGPMSAIGSPGSMRDAPFAAPLHSPNARRSALRQTRQRPARLRSCQTPRRWEIPSPKDVVSAAEAKMDAKWERMSDVKRLQSADVKSVPSAIAVFMLKKDRMDPDANTATPVSSRQYSFVESESSCSALDTLQGMCEEQDTLQDDFLARWRLAGQTGLETN